MQVIGTSKAKQTYIWFYKEKNSLLLNAIQLQAVCDLVTYLQTLQNLVKWETAVY